MIKSSSKLTIITSSKLTEVSTMAGSPENAPGFLRSLTSCLGAVALMIYSPNMVMFMWYAAVHCDGSFSELAHRIMAKGVVVGVCDIWSMVTIGSPAVLAIIFGYMVFAVVLQMVLPGPRAEGPVTPKGNTPVYKDNGFSCYVVTMLAFLALTAYLKQHGMTPTIVYDKFDEVLVTLTLFSLVFCVLLQLKGYFLPSTSDHGSSGNLIFDFYWGTELYPRVCGVDVKVFTNCRFGLTVWALLVLIFGVKSYELHGFVDSMWVSAVLQLVYLTKFFWWEAGYMRTIDIMVDRAGYYICWGCLVYVTGFYTSVSMYMVNKPVQLGPQVSCVILAAGLASIAVNYLADKQKQDARASDGKCLIWGKPARVIRAKYTLESGEKRESILLASGWWGVARHFHYVPELALAFFWTVPAGFENIMPYSYVIFLFFLLTHRTFRDDEKCSAKYGANWARYQKEVPYKMIPYIF